MSDYQYSPADNFFQSSARQAMEQANQLEAKIKRVLEIEEQVANETFVNTVEPFRMTEPQKRRRDARLAEIKPLLENRDEKR